MLQKAKNLIHNIAAFKNIYIIGDGIRGICLKKYIETIYTKNVILLNYEHLNKQDFFSSELNITKEDSCFLFEKDYTNETDSKLFLCRTIFIEKDFKQTKKLLLPFIQKNKINYFEIDNVLMDLVQRKLMPIAPQDFYFEVHVADHCNLNCQMCTHYAPISQKKFYEIQKFKKDISRLAELFQHKISGVSLLGGEPLLNKDITEYIIHTRKEFPDASILVHSNGILLLRDDNDFFWNVCRNNNITVAYTIYPIKLNYELIEQKGKEYGVKTLGFVEAADKKYNQSKLSSRLPLNINGKIDKEDYIGCFKLNMCTNLNDGKIFPCPTVAYINKVNNKFGTNFVMHESDYIDIYKAQNAIEICEFISNRIPFCDYCDIANITYGIPWKRSTRQADEWIDYK